MSKKQDLRVQLLQQRKSMQPDGRAAMNQAICDAVLAWCRANQPAVLALYMPIRGEPDLRPAAAALAALGIQLALPVVVERDAPLAFAAWTPGEEMTRDLAGVTVPAGVHRMVEPDTLLIPCLGYNHQRYRLGYGAGYYDRTLAARPGVRAIGIAWSASRVEFTPDAFDVPMDVIVTETGLA
ncbi:5-formyltetrahydrofolate cyclo-ligase [Lacisediminimonas profundi]|uniref:5-formyltetrahydrofolate cyclo-ligase n=1 Tax=Lacisediminimonas profundi TaxID=2603856 RepID=UPI00124B4932|nr:5-formyltetrahydrofolate cyclo-ligase [Lacisediminimonas profundi]